MQPSGPATDPAKDYVERDLFAWGLLAGVLLCGALAGPFFAGRVYTHDDLGAFHLPIRAFYAGQLARGEPFDWSPQLFSGFYLTGEGQAGMYHPLHLFLYRCLPLQTALALELLASYPFMLAGTYCFLRRRIKRGDAAMLGSLVFTFSSFNLLHFVHPNAVAVVAHIPWLLWAIDVLVLDPNRRKVVAAEAIFALLTGSQLLLGYPQYVWFSLLAECGFAWLVIKQRKEAGRTRCGDRIVCDACAGCNENPWLRLALGKGLGVMLGGVQLLPAIDALTHSARQAADGPFANWGSLAPLNLVQLVAPYLFVDRVAGQNTHELGLYVGAVPLMLMVWLLIRRRQLETLRPLAQAAVGFGLLALLLALGEYGPLYWLQRFVPLVGSFRFPCRYLVLFDLAAAVMAAIGFVLLVRDNESGIRLPWHRFGPVWTVVAASIALAVVGLAYHREPFVAWAPAVLAGPLLIATAAVLVFLAVRGSRPALVGLILLTAADLGCYGLSYAVYPYTHSFDRYVAGTDCPPAESDGRVLGDLMSFDQPGRRMGDRILLAGWHRADGYVGLQPARQLDYGQLAALRTAGVRWVKRGDSTARVEGLVPYDRQWLEVPRPLPRVRLVSRVRWSADPAGDIAQIHIESTALVEEPLLLDGAPPGRAALRWERPGRLDIRVDCTTPQLLVIAESYHPGWQARVDHEPRQVFRTNGDFMGCLVGPGDHDVVLEFQPRSLRDGRIVSFLGIGLLLVCFTGRMIRPPS